MKSYTRSLLLLLLITLIEIPFLVSSPTNSTQKTAHTSQKSKELSVIAWLKRHKLLAAIASIGLGGLAYTLYHYLDQAPATKRLVNESKPTTTGQSKAPVAATDLEGAKTSAAAIKAHNDALMQKFPDKIVGISATGNIIQIKAPDQFSPEIRKLAHTGAFCGGLAVTLTKALENVTYTSDDDIAKIYTHLNDYPFLERMINEIVKKRDENGKHRSEWLDNGEVHAFMEKFNMRSRLIPIESIRKKLIDRYDPLCFAVEPAHGCFFTCTEESPVEDPRLTFDQRAEKLYSILTELREQGIPQHLIVFIEREHFYGASLYKETNGTYRMIAYNTGYGNLCQSPELEALFTFFTSAPLPSKSLMKAYLNAHYFYSSQDKIAQNVQSAFDKLHNAVFDAIDDPLFDMLESAFESLISYLKELFGNTFSRTITINNRDGEPIGTLHLTNTTTGKEYLTSIKQALIAKITSISSTGNIIKIRVPDQFSRDIQKIIESKVLCGPLSIAFTKLIQEILQKHDNTLSDDAIIKIYTTLNNTDNYDNMVKEIIKACKLKEQGLMDDEDLLASLEKYKIKCRFIDEGAIRAYLNIKTYDPLSFILSPANGDEQRNFLVPQEKSKPTLQHNENANEEEIKKQAALLNDFIRTLRHLENPESCIIFQNHHFYGVTLGKQHDDVYRMINYDTLKQSDNSTKLLEDLFQFFTSRHVPSENFIAAYLCILSKCSNKPLKPADVQKLFADIQKYLTPEVIAERSTCKSLDTAFKILTKALFMKRIDEKENLPDVTLTFKGSSFLLTKEATAEGYFAFIEKAYGNSKTS